MLHGNAPSALRAGLRQPQNDVAVTLAAPVDKLQPDPNQGRRGVASPPSLISGIRRLTGSCGGRLTSRQPQYDVGIAFARASSAAELVCDLPIEPDPDEPIGAH